MDDNLSLLKASLQLFDRLNCCSSSLNGDFDNVFKALALVDEDKMRCHIFNCLIALTLVHTEKRKKEYSADDGNYEMVKGKVFNAAISMILDDEELNSNEAVVKTILSGFPFPDEVKIADKRSWFPQHFTIALGVRNKISEDDIRIMLSVNPLPMQRLSKKKANALIVRDESDRCALHLVAQYSESLELLEDILQIDHKMTKMVFEFEDTEQETTPLGLLCSRPHFPTLDAMVLCLIEVDNSVEVIFDGMINCLMSYKYNEGFHQDTSPGSRGAKSLILLRTLLDANPAVAEYDDSHIFHEACMFLRGELCISVLSLLLSKNGTGLKVVNYDRDGDLPIHDAAAHSCLEVVKFLHKAYPESISMMGNYGSSLLHLAVFDNSSDPADVIAKVQYLCEQCPALIHLKDNRGGSAFHKLLMESASNFDCVRILCDMDWTVVRDKYTPSSIHSPLSGQLPLHLLIERYSPIREVSDEGDCFRLLLSLYPAAAGIKDDHSRRPYDMAVSKNLSAYFLRLLLAADPTIAPGRRHRLNFAARRQGMFLDYRALSSNVEPTIWSKMRLKGRDLLQHVISYL
jgi:ankyrin repeat protein